MNLPGRDHARCREWDCRERGKHRARGLSLPKTIGKNAGYEMKECLDVLQGIKTKSGTTITGELPLRFRQERIIRFLAPERYEAVG